MSAEFNDRMKEVLPAGTIVYPEIEALRYLISEQKKEMELLRQELLV